MLLKLCPLIINPAGPQTVSLYQLNKSGDKPHRSLTPSVFVCVSTHEKRNAEMTTCFS